MSRKFQVKTIPSRWLETDGRRLDCGPYMSGAVEARELLNSLPSAKEALNDLVSGIYHAGRESRTWVESPEHGVPFMGSTDILAADLSHINLISKKQVEANPNFKIGEGWTLITRSGTIGRMAYAHSGMDGLACSEHVMRVVPDEDKVKPGFIYAYLSSMFGVPLVISGTYGSIIQSIEPHHISDLPVPRLGDIENQAHELVQRAADLRVEATALLKQAGIKVNETFGLPEKLALSHRNFSCAVASSNNVMARMEATFHDGIAQESDRLIDAIPAKDYLIDLGVSFGETGRLKQVFVEQEFGEPFLTSGEIFRQIYAPSRFLSRRLLPDDNSWATQEGDLLLARSGQVGGIIGRGVWADSRFNSACVSVDVIRISAQNASILPGYLYAYLFLTDVGYRQLIRTAAGSSIPHLSVSDVQKLLIPRGESEFEEEVNDMVWKAGRDRAEAQQLEDEARILVERTIKEGGR
ncbi:methylation-associated defense system restriction endonuclease subunit S MAD5 [Marinicella pacifica]|nr:restriction endonuclease subunit S [Marinicella pacifica]